MNNKKVFNSVEWVDAQEMALEHPTTFEAPSQKELDNLTVGKIVKVCDLVARERFWTQITEINGKYIIARVVNDLIGEQDYGYNDLIKFEKRNIFAIH